MLTLFFKKFGGYILTFLSFVAGLLTIIFAYKKQGENEAQLKAQKQNNKDTEAIAIRKINETKEASKRESEVLENAISQQNKAASLDDNNANQRLRDKWSRD